MPFSEYLQNKDGGVEDAHPLERHSLIEGESQGIPVPTIINSDHTSYANNGTLSGSNVKFTLPQNGILDFNNGVIEFEVAVNNTNRAATTVTAIHNGIYSIFDQVKLTIGNSEVELFERAGHFQVLFYEWYGSVNMNNNQGVLWGIATQGVRSTYTNNGDGATWQPYMIPIPSKILSGCILPMDLIPEVKLSLHIGDPANYIEIAPAGSGTTASDITVTVRNARIHCRMIEAMAEWHEKRRVQLASEGIACRYFEMAHQNFPVNSNSANLSVDFKAGSVDSIILLQRVDGDVQDIHVADRLVNTIRDNLSTWKIKRGVHLWPHEPVNVVEYGGQRGYMMFLQWLEKFHGFKWMQEELPQGLTLANFYGPAAAGDNRFVVAMDFEAFPGSRKMNFFGTAESRDPLQIILAYTAPPAAQLSVDVFLGYWNVIVLRSDSATRLL